MTDEGEKKTLVVVGILFPRSLHIRLPVVHFRKMFLKKEESNHVLFLTANNNFETTRDYRRFF